MKMPFISNFNKMIEDDGVETRHGVSLRLPVITIISIVIALGSAVWGISQSFTSYRIQENRNLISQHIVDAEHHMSMERKIQLFVLRQEYDKDIKDIKTNLESINKKLDELREEQ